MHPALIRVGTKNILLKSRKKVTTQILRIYADKQDEIKLPPEPTTCCMSGCANCVWIEYAKTVSKLLEGNDEKAREIILQKISDPNLKMFLSIELKNLQNEQNANANSKNSDNSSNNANNTNSTETSDAEEKS